MSSPSDSVLNSVKSMIGISADETVFDDQILIFINATLSTLEQLGVPFKITPVAVDSTRLYSDLLDDELLLGYIQAYMGVKSRMLFDTPPASTVVNALDNAAKEWEWRIMIECDNRFAGPVGGDDDG